MNIVNQTKKGHDPEVMKAFTFIFNEHLPDGLVFANLVKRMDASLKLEESLSKEEMLEELQELRTMRREVKAKMECPVCLTIPREGPPPCCPRGHIICKGCFDKIKGSQGVCPTCREPMGGGKNLLAMVLIENIRHQCDLNGCKEMVLFKNYKQHQKECKYRLVKCPGSNFRCSTLVPFCEVEDHANRCSDIIAWSNPGKASFQAKKDAFEKETLVPFRTKMFHAEGELFFFRLMKNFDYFDAEIVMHADQEKCNRYTATISLLDPRSKTVYSASVHPRPIGASNDVEDCLSVKMKRFLKVCQDMGDKFRFTFRVTIEKEKQDTDENDM